MAPMTRKAIYTEAFSHANPIPPRRCSRASWTPGSRGIDHIVEITIAAAG